MSKRIIGVNDSKRIVYLVCGHNKIWPVQYLAGVGYYKDLSLPKIGQITECAKCNEDAPPDPVPMTICRRPTANWRY